MGGYGEGGVAAAVTRRGHAEGGTTALTYTP
jgi:hypothetical protein